MNLVDVLVGGLVFSLACASSLEIYGSSLRWAHGQEQRQATATAQELALVEAASLLRQKLDLATTYPDCSIATDALVDALQGVPVPEGLTRVVQHDADLVSITLRAENLPERRRWFSPAAYGLCGAPTP